MTRRTLYFGSPAYLSTVDNQLRIERELGPEDVGEAITHVPIEDVGTVLLDHSMITITQPLLRQLIASNVSVISCDESHMPCGLFLPLAASGVQPERFRYQLRASGPLKKQLWAQTVQAKILNQAGMIETAIGLNRSHITQESNLLADGRLMNMRKWAGDLRSGDPMNLEGRAAAFYWANFFPAALEFRRDRFGEPPNNLLNYGYAILRAMTAQALVASGMPPTQGIHHSNKYNAFPLADDIMEPYRPYVDHIVRSVVTNGEDFSELDRSIKQQLLSLATTDVVMNGKRRPLHIAVQRSATSLAYCFLGERRKILYPDVSGVPKDPGTSE
jgi:CRISPR-associated protein Cas1